jgi:hypothetical protein
LGYHNLKNIYYNIGLVLNFAKEKLIWLFAKSKKRGYQNWKWNSNLLFQKNLF